MLVRRFFWSLLAAAIINLALLMISLARAVARARGDPGAYWLTFSPLKVLVSTIVIAVVLVLVSVLIEWLYSWTFR